VSAGHASYAKEWLQNLLVEHRKKDVLPIIKQTQRPVSGFIGNFFKRLRLRTKSLLT
jgi:hypothetical protein